MNISKEQVQHVSALARLKMHENEIDKLTEEMANIINLADKLNELDTTGVEPSAHAIAVYNVLREDEVVPSYSREQILQNAPSQDGYNFIVPKVVE